MYNRHRTWKFFFGFNLATAAALTILFGPYVLGYEFFHPQGFWEKIVFFALTIGGFIPLSITAFFAWLGIASRFE